MTNALKGIVISLFNALVMLLAAFDVYSLTEEQSAAILAVINAGFAAWISLTAKNSPARDPEYSGRV